MGGYEIIEHTADVGVLAHGNSPEEVFEHAALGLLEIAGAVDPQSTGVTEHSVLLEGAGDLAALMVDWLNELIWIQESNPGRVTRVVVDAVDVDAGSVKASMWTDPRSPAADGTAVKAATFHQIEVQPEGDGWRVRVYLDV